MKKRLLLCAFLAILLNNNTYAKENLKEQFSQNSAMIYTINIRNFGAVDKDNNGIIDIEKGDIKGTFLNAKEKLSSLAQEGINTIYLLPITKTGKLKALGTAGSLYAMDSFNEISQDLDDKENPKSVFEEAQEFIKEAHKHNLNVIVDLPSCGSYDLSLNKPGWFMLDKNNEAIIPADWTDVRLFKIYNDDNSLNKETLQNFKNFIDMTQNLEIDGIRADVAAIKPPEFWIEIINYAKEKNPNFIFIAEANPQWDNPAPNAIHKYSTVDELLNAGFDGYYGSFSDFSSIKTKEEFDKKIEKNLKILKKHKNKAIMATFATHDQQAPILRGENYWNMILWLSTTLPLNSYFLDGFSIGDSFIYEYENKKAPKSQTDDEYYFVHSGKFDIFNFTRNAYSNHSYLKNNYIKAIKFKNSNLDLFKNGAYKTLKTNNDKVFAYSMKSNNKELIILGSLDDKNHQQAQIKLTSLKKDNFFSIIHSKNNLFKKSKDKLSATLEPLEIKVFLINQANSQAN